MHWYGKKGVSKNRKLGHVTIIGTSAEEAASRLQQLDPAAAEALQRSDSFKDLANQTRAAAFHRFAYVLIAVTIVKHASISVS